MLAFHGKSEIKETYLARVRAHALADEIAHGFYWENGKGCAVGCTIHSGAHKNYETELGIPIMLARLEDRLFEGMSNGKSKEFPERFLSAIPVGADLSLVGWKFLHWLLTEELVSSDHPKVKDAIKRSADVLVPLTKGLPVDREEAIAARIEANCAASCASCAAAAAAAAAAFYPAAAASFYPADAAAAAAAFYPAAAARSKSFSRMADKLIELISQA
jgi:hypothetical protein